MNQKPLLLLALGLATSLPTLACTTCDDKPAATTTTATTTAAAPSGDALTVVRDAASGQLRPPTAAELANLTRAQTTSARTARSVITPAVPTTVLVRRAPNGAVNVRLTPEFASYAVVVRQADGTLAERCVHAPDASGALAQTRADATPVNQTAELQ